MRVLIVEDEKKVAAAVRRGLEAEGFAVDVALTGTDGLWMAYILTRPLGASIGDYLSQPKSAGGLNLGTTTTSVIFLAAIAAVVLYLTKTKKDQIVLAVDGDDATVRTA